MTQMKTPPAKTNTQVSLAKQSAEGRAKPVVESDSMRTAFLHVKRGNSFSMAVEPELAIKEFNTALKLVPDLPEALLGRGMANIDLENFSDALADLEKVGASSNPLKADALINAGTVNFRLKNYAAAIADFENLVKPQIKICLLLLICLNATFAWESPISALKEINIASKIAGNHELHQAACRRVRAKVYCALGQYDKAVEDYSVALSYLIKHNDNGEVLLSCALLRTSVLVERAKAYDHLGKPDLAQRDRDALHSESSDILIIRRFV